MVKKIAKKLSFQISKETKSVKNLLEEYSACQPSLSDKICLPEALDPSFIGDRLHKIGTWGSVASGKRRAVIDAYLAACRSREEIEMLREDALNTCTFYERKFERSYKRFRIKRIPLVEEQRPSYVTFWT